MFEGGTRDTNVTTAVNRIEKQAFENVANAYNCSQAAMNRLLILRAHRDLFGDIHPEAVPSGTIDTDALLSGDLEPDDVDERFRMDGDAPAQVPTADGGVAAAPTPSSYTPTYTPKDLADGGVELTWDELKDAVGRHWSDDLEVHPERVRSSDDVEIIGEDDYSNDECALKTSTSTVGKILAGILRTKGEAIPESILEETILEYTSHQITRADRDAGRQYKVETYKRVLVKECEYVFAHPDPLKDIYYTSEAAAKEHFGKEVEKTIRKLIDDSKWVLDPKEHAQSEQINPKTNPSAWVDDLASFRQRLGFLHAVRESDRWANWLSDLDTDMFDEFPTPQAAVGKTFTEMVNQYRRVNHFARFAAANAVLEVDDDSILEPTIFDENDEEITVNVDRPIQPHTKWVVQRETPLSGPEQIKAVGEKL